MPKRQYPNSALAPRWAPRGEGSRLPASSEHDDRPQVVVLYTTTILCREPHRSLREVLRPHSLIILGGKARWRPTQAQRRVRRLRQAGHGVISVGSE